MVFMNSQIWTVPNMLTFFRFFLVPVIVAFVLMNQSVYLFLAALLFALAAVTDWLDGVIARKTKSESKLGIYLDPLVDKILVHSILIVVSLIHLIPFWMAMVLIARDIITSAVRSYVVRHNISVRAVASGKLKMALQTISIALVFIVALMAKWGIALEYIDVLFILVQLCLFVTLLVSYVGLIDFFIKNKEAFKKTELARFM